jgi:hypothetical protein
MIKLTPVALGLILALAMLPPARAQVTWDIAKITCEQYTGYKITNPQRGDTTLDPQGLLAQAKKVRDFCFRNPQTLVMDAVEKLFETSR